MDKEKYSLIGCSDNAFGIMGYVEKCMRKEGKTKAEIESYSDDAESGSYHHLVSVSQNMIDDLNTRKIK